MSLVLVILMSHFEAARGLFWDRPYNFEPRSDHEDDTSTGTPSPNFLASSVGGHLATTDVTCTRPAHMAVLRWNRVSNLEPSCSKVEILPPGHYSP
ncbi:hypothetical protein AVEN_146830-1 [Araneus ventricosus]|uniref:Secreted protein n=1 Tax=Araneus ventricosus TaxID=182803 RepID=A0A4Y2MDU5_ARAVE|nr:hypothetical protein AVEN_146830-1 [Araneus ventricosus]